MSFFFSLNYTQNDLKKWMNGVDKTHKSWWATELFPARNSCRALEGHQPIRLPRFLSLRRRRVFEFGQQIPDRIRISSAAEAAAVLFVKQQKRLSSFKVHATVAEKDGEPKWWERNAGPNMIDIHSTEEFLSALSQAGDKLVIVEFYGTWCGSCRALLPKLCKTAEEHPDILFLKVNFNENKPMCKRLNVKVVPSFHFYRGADGLLESFSCSLAKFQKIKEAIEKHNSSRCSLGPPLGVGDLDLLGPS